MSISRKHLGGVVRIVLGFGLLYYVLAITGGWSAARRLVSTPWLLPSLVTMTFFGAAIESKRLGLLCSAQGLHLSFGHGYRLVAVGTLFNYCIPGGTGGDVMKLYYLAADNRGKGVEVATVLLVDRAVAVFSLLLLAVAAALSDGSLLADNLLIRWLVAAAIVGIIGLLAGSVVACSARLRGSKGYAYLMARLPLSGYLERAANSLYAFREHKAALIGAVGLSLIGHSALAGVFTATSRVLIPHAPGLTVVSLAFLGIFANALPVTPGGLGVGEAAFEGLFHSAGYAGGAQLSLAWRAGTLGLSCVGALLYIAGVRKKNHCAKPDSESVSLAPSPWQKADAPFPYGQD